jgi:hypothetical protein
MTDAVFYSTLSSALPSSRRRGPSTPQHQRSSRSVAAYWTPACAGMTMSLLHGERI